MIEVTNLTKKYGPNTAVDGLSFKIRPGHIYGLLGPNGAGKSTTMNIIAGCLAPTSGSVVINGFDILDNPIEAKKQIGYLPEIPPLWDYMTPYEFLMFVAEAKKMKYERAVKQVREVMELTGITGMKDRLCRNLSKGYRQRVGVAQAMLGDPDIIILDEPTVGLDPKQIIEMREIIRTLGEKKTVIISSHILSEISAVCDHVIIISHGTLVADDDITALQSRIATDTVILLSVRGDANAVDEVLNGIGNIESYEIGKKDAQGLLPVKVTAKKGTDPREEIFFAMADRRIAVVLSEIQENDLEQVFLSLTGDTGTPIPDIPEQTEDNNAEPADGDSDDNGEDEDK